MLYLKLLIVFWLPICIHIEITYVQGICKRKLFVKTKDTRYIHTRFIHKGWIKQNQKTFKIYTNK